VILQELLVPLILDDSKFNSGIDGAIDKSNGLTKGLSNVGGMVFGGAVAGLGILTAGLFDATKGAMDAELIQSDLNAVLASTNGISGMTADSINDLSTALSEVTMFEDDVITAGSNMLLTFTSIGKDVFPQATEAMLNMAQKMGKEPKDMAVMLGKALNDPAEGLSALTRNGVVFTEEQQNMIKAMQESGDIAGAQAIILSELEKEFGGVARAAGETSQGTLERFKNLIGNIKDSIGGAVIPALTTLGQTLLETFNKPEVQLFIDNLVSGIGYIANQAVLYLPAIIQGFSDFVSFLQNNQGVVVGVLGALGVAVIAFGITVATATWTALAPFLPVIAIMALVGVAAYALYEAWTNNFMGIQDKVKEVWAYLEPIFNNIKNWLAVNVPIAIQALSDYWNNVLLPAMMNVWSFIQDNYFPLFKALGDFLGQVFTLAIGQARKAWEFYLPIVKGVFDWMKNNVMPILSPIADFIGGYFTWVFGNLAKTIGFVTDALNWATEALKIFNGTSVSDKSIFSPSDSSAQIKGRATGGYSSGLTWVGERGAELVNLPAGSNVRSNSESMSILGSGANEIISAIKDSKLDEERLVRMLTSAIQQGR
jgi:hypothetical protein